MLKGDIKPAVETHEMLYQVMQRHNFIPEAFTTDFQVTIKLMRIMLNYLSTGLQKCRYQLNLVKILFYQEFYDVLNN